MYPPTATEKLIFPSPCPHCGKDNETKWCYEYLSQDGGLFGVCKRESPPAPGWEQTEWTDSQGTRKYRIPKEVKRTRKKAERCWYYETREGRKIRVCRTDDGQGKRRIWQERLEGRDKWVHGLGDIKREEILPYNYHLVSAAIAAGELIFIVEGEPCCDVLQKLRINATTNLGGSLKWLKQHSQDLEGASVVLVPDRDQKGLDHMKRIAQDFPHAQWLYPNPDSPLWRHLPKDGGLDIADWIGDGVSVEDIMDSIGKIPHPPQPEEESPEVPPRLPALPSALTQEQVRAKIEEIIATGLDGSLLTQAINETAKDSAYQIKELWRLYNERSDEIEREQVRSERKEEIKELLNFSEQTLDLHDYLHPALAHPLNKISNLLGLNPSAMLVTLFPAAASLLPLGNKLELIRATQFYAYPILYTGLVAESASTKSPAQKAILRPLFQLQHEAESNFQNQLEDWNKRKNEAKEAGEWFSELEPRPREYYTTDATAEAIATIQCNQPERGFLIYRDELAGMLKDSNAYRSGKGSDVEKILSARDGTGIKINRASGQRKVAKQSGFSITGSIQPDVLRRQMGDLNDSNGYWARFLWVKLGVNPSPYPDSDVVINIEELLYELFQRLAGIEPKTFFLSDEAKALYKSWYNELDQQRLDEPRQGLRAVYGKFKGVTGELALLLHTINGVIESTEVETFVSRQTMIAAIQLAKFFLGQTKLLYAEESPQEGLEPIYAHLIEISKEKGWLSARLAQRSNRSLKTLPSDAVRSHFREIEAMGFGVTRGQGKKLEWRILSKESVANVAKTPQSHTGKGIEVSTKASPNVANVAKPVTQTGEERERITPLDRESSASFGDGNSICRHFVAAPVAKTQTPETTTEQEPRCQKEAFGDVGDAFVKDQKREGEADTTKNDQQYPSTLLASEKAEREHKDYLELVEIVSRALDRADQSTAEVFKRYGCTSLSHLWPEDLALLLKTLSTDETGITPGDRVRYVGSDPQWKDAFSLAGKKRKPVVCDRLEGDKAELTSQAWGENRALVPISDLKPFVAGDEKKTPKQQKSKEWKTGDRFIFPHGINPQDINDVDGPGESWPGEIVSYEASYWIVKWPSGKESVLRDEQVKMGIKIEGEEGPAPFMPGVKVRYIGSNPQFCKMFQNTSQSKGVFFCYSKEGMAKLTSKAWKVMPLVPTAELEVIL